MLVTSANCVVNQLIGKASPLGETLSFLPLQSGLPLVASCCRTVVIEVYGNTGRSTGNHLIFLHQFGTIGESDRQFVIL